MGAPTSITPQDFHDVASAHRDHEHSLASEAASLQHTIDQLNTTCWGDLMEEFNAIHEEWADDVEKLRAKINDLAEFLDEAAKNLQSTDSGSVGTLRR